MSLRLDSLHAQLIHLLENAQSLLADSSPTSISGTHHPYQRGMGGGHHSVTTTGHHHHHQVAVYSFTHMQAEIRTLEFWRSIIAECIATFFYCVIGKRVLFAKKTKAQKFKVQVSLFAHHQIRETMDIKSVFSFSEREEPIIFFSSSLSAAWATAILLQPTKRQTSTSPLPIDYF